MKTFSFTILPANIIFQILSLWNVKKREREIQISSVGGKLPPLAELSSPDIATPLNLVTVKNSVPKNAAIMFLNILEEVIEEMTLEFGIPSMNETNSP